MKSRILRTIALTGVGLLVSLPVVAQSNGSSRPRRVNKTNTTRTDNNRNSGDSLLDVVPASGGKTTSGNSSSKSSSSSKKSNPDEPLLTPLPSPEGMRAGSTSGNSNSSDTSGSETANSSNETATPTSRKSANTAATPAPAPNNPNDTTHAFQLLKLKQYDAAAKEAGVIAQRDPTNSEAWKIVGFAKMNLKQNGEAADALQRALDLQRTAKQEDPNTVDALALAYARSENYDRAYPLLVTATGRPSAKPDPVMLYYKGVSAYHLKKPVDAEKAFNEAVKADPKDAASLFFLGRIAMEKNDYTAAIGALNRATVADPRSAAAWGLLTTAYLKRAALSEDDPQKASADYTGAVRAGEGLTKVKNDLDSATLFAQALIQAQQFARAAMVLDRFGSAPDANPTTLYLLGLAHSRAKNFPKAIAALERAAAKNTNDASIYRELGYDYEASRQFAKALAVYQKGATIAPDDAFFKDSIARVTPYAK
jgi:tetratricopeptide (TPR) repeat protein